MTVALYATVWLALILFVVGELGKRAWSHGRAGRLASTLWLGGALLCAIHIVVAFAGPHRWSHDAAIRETARQTEAVYGIDFGGGIYLNYLFVVVWTIEAWWWRTRPAQYLDRPRAVAWALRAFYFVVIANAAIVFATPIGRFMGVPLVALLLWTWAVEPRGRPALSSPP